MKKVIIGLIALIIVIAVGTALFLSSNTDVKQPGIKASSTTLYAWNAAGISTVGPNQTIDMPNMDSTTAIYSKWESTGELSKILSADSVTMSWLFNAPSTDTVLWTIEARPSDNTTLIYTVYTSSAIAGATTPAVSFANIKMLGYGGQYRIKVTKKSSSHANLKTDDLSLGFCPNKSPSFGYRKSYTQSWPQ